MLMRCSVALTRADARRFVVGTDEKQYWVSFGFLTVLESAVNAVYWFPFYYPFKLALILYMALPQFK